MTTLPRAAMPCALALTLLAAPPAVAAEPTLNASFPDLTHDVAYDDAPSPHLPGPIEGGALGPLSMHFEETPLATIAAAFGGQISSQGDAGDFVSWSCYGDASGTVWFLADGEMGNDWLNTLAFEATPPRPEWNCVQKPAAALVTDLPAIGTSLADIRARFGPSPLDKQGRFYYLLKAPSNEAGLTLFQYFAFEEHEGRITALSISQLSEED